MITTSQTFYDNSIFKYRSTKSEVTINVFDLTAKEDINNISVNAYTKFVESQLHDGQTYEYDYATCELNEFKLDGSMTLLPDTITDEQIGWWSAMSDANGLFASNPTITFTLNNQHSTAGITCDFGVHSHPLKAKCWWFSGNLLLESMEIESDDAIQVFNKGVNGFDKIVIEVLKANPYSYVKMATMDFGITKTFTGKELKTISVKENTSLMCNTISPNELNFSIFNYDYYYNVFESANLYSYFKQGQEITVRSAVLNRETEQYECIPMGTFYVSNATVDNGMLDIKAYGILDTLNNSYFYSPFYSNESIEDIIGDILDGYDYYVHPNIKDITLTGYIPFVSKKEALKYVLIACTGVCKEGRDGKIYLFKPTEELSHNQIVQGNTMYDGCGLCGLMNTIVQPMPFISTPHSYVLTVDRSQRLSQIKTSLIGVYTKCMVQYSNYTSSASKELFNDTITTDSNGTAIIEYEKPVNVTNVSGGVATNYATCSIITGTPNTQYTIVVTGTEYETTTNIASSVVSTTNAYDDAKLTMELKNCNTLISNSSRALDCASWYLSQLQKRKDIEYEWYSVATVEAADYIRVETSDGSVSTMEITEIDYDLITLNATVKGIM